MPNVCQEIVPAIDWSQVVRFNELEREKMVAAESENYEKAIELRDQMLDLKLSTAIDQADLNRIFSKFQDFITLVKDFLSDSHIKQTLCSVTCPVPVEIFEQTLSRIASTEFSNESDIQRCDKEVEETVVQFKISLGSFSSKSPLPKILVGEDCSKVISFVNSFLREAECKLNIFRTFRATEQALILKSERFLEFMDQISILSELGECYSHTLSENKDKIASIDSNKTELFELTRRISFLQGSIAESCGLSLKSTDHSTIKHLRLDQGLLNECRIKGVFNGLRDQHAVCEYCGQFSIGIDHDKQVNPCANLFERSLST